MSQTFSISTTISAGIEATVFEIFSLGLKTSVTTGYNWSKSQKVIYSEMVRERILQTVAPGTKFVIKQAIGSCGESYYSRNYFHTDYFATENMDLRSGTMTRSLGRMHRNGTFEITEGPLNYRMSKAATMSLKKINSIHQVLH